MNIFRNFSQYFSFLRTKKLEDIDPNDTYRSLFHLVPEKCVQERAETATIYQTNIKFIRRIVEFYYVCCEKTKISTDSMWNFISTLKKDVHKALLDDYYDGGSSNSAKILSDPINSELWYGFAGPTKSQYVPSIATKQCSWEYDLLYRLAQSCGCVTMPNFENLALALNLDYPSVEVLLEKLDVICGTHILVSNVYPHVAGLKTERGVIDYRMINGLYCAKRLKDMGANRVLEIGGGWVGLRTILIFWE